MWFFGKKKPEDDVVMDALRYLDKKLRYQAFIGEVSKEIHKGLFNPDDEEEDDEEDDD